MSTQHTETMKCTCRYCTKFSLPAYYSRERTCKHTHTHARTHTYNHIQKYIFVGCLYSKDLKALHDMIKSIPASL